MEDGNLTPYDEMEMVVRKEMVRRI